MRALLMDQHGSHMTPEFVLKATGYNIHPFPFPGHLTHVLQPLDVAVFQPYKHWHRKAVQAATRNLDPDYTISSFFRDLPEIRANTFKDTTILNAFRKAGVWPINSEIALAKMKLYQPPTKPPELKLPCTPTRGIHAEQLLQEIELRLEETTELRSSPLRRKMKSTFRGARNILINSELVGRELDILTEKVIKQQKARTTKSNRRSIQKGGVLTVKDATRKIKERDDLEKALLEKKKATVLRVTRNKVVNTLHKEGIQARRWEKERVRLVQDSQRTNRFPPVELYSPIPDPEKLLTEVEIDVQVRELLVSHPLFNGVSFEHEELATIDPRLWGIGDDEEEEDEEYITQKEFISQQDYISFSGPEDSEEEDDDDAQFTL
jgi:hypothetical protein